MANGWPWFERAFTFDFPPAKLPELVERLRGAPMRVAERARAAPRDSLATPIDGTWSIKRNIGHLVDLEALWLGRLDDMFAGAETLRAADVENRATSEADHDARSLDELLDGFATVRGEFVGRLESIDEADWGRSARHPRLDQPMRVVDIAHFAAEHDDYHIARITELGRLLRGVAP